jgi:hypothetical protein
VKRRRERRRKHVLDDLKETGGYSQLKEEILTTSPSVENSLCKSLWTCRKADCRMRCVFSYLHNKQRLFPKTTLTVESLLTETDSVSCEVEFEFFMSHLDEIHFLKDSCA